MRTKMAVWEGELLWPQKLEESSVVDMGKVTAVGSWLYSWFREHPETSVVAALPDIKRQLQTAGLPILWYATCSSLRPVQGGGVSPSEREMLWS